MADMINWGILGASKFARQQMAPAIHMAKGARIHALASGSPDKAAEIQAFAPDLTLYSDYDSLLADPEVDAVYIPLPNHLHLEWSLKALAANKSVLCEKPMTMAAEQFDELIAKRDKTGLLAAEAYMIVHHPQWQLVRDLVGSGEVGTLIHVDAAFSYNNAADVDNIRNRPETGGGSLPDIGVYTIGSCRYVTGAEPVEITHADITYQNNVDVIARFSARFPGFTFNSLTSMWMAPRQEVTFHGDKGHIKLTAPFNPSVYSEAQVTLEQGMERRNWRFPNTNHYVNQVENFGAAMRGETAFLCPLEFSKGTQEMMDQVFNACPR